MNGTRIREFMLTIPKANGEGNTRSELMVELRLRGAGTDSAPGDEVSHELGETVSRSSDPTGTPRFVRSHKS